jgi:3-hydroxymyristoyl/3-hydroxydecanoyl-(acyl carrier protein) dehydratase
MPDQVKDIQSRYKAWSLDHSTRMTSTHNQMLDLRKLGLDKVASEISRSMGNNISKKETTSCPLFDLDWLTEFSKGDIVKCLGSEFGIYKNRRSPRIPNGDLLLMSSIVSIQGNRGDFVHASHITAELEIPSDAWYFDGTVQGEIPVSIMLEIALQPCGVLSAWLGTQLRFPSVDFFFRNLDGDVHFKRKVDARGKTFITTASLDRTVFSGSTIIQHFTFDISCEGEKIFTGTSSFGYFPEETMASQNGLDGGKSSQPWGKKLENAGKIIKILPTELFAYSDLPSGKLRLIEDVGVSLDDGTNSKGYVIASKHNSPDDWFYTNHFFQDPVMPGSLGIEAVIQAFKAAIHRISKSGKPVSVADGSELKWKYRGQVLQNHSDMYVDATILSKQTINGVTVFTGTANLWADDIRIYEIQNLALQQE